jgi:hypothetical protein
VTNIVFGSGRHRRLTLLDRALDWGLGHPVLWITGGVAIAFITSAFITVMQKVT